MILSVCLFLSLSSSLSLSPSLPLPLSLSLPLSRSHFPPHTHTLTPLLPTNSNYLLFDRDVIDVACEDSRGLRFPEDMRLELFFASVDDQPDLSLSLAL